ncbi:MAG: ATP-binding protein [Candidatus Hydrogenedentota bacterium]
MAEDAHDSRQSAKNTTRSRFLGGSQQDPAYPEWTREGGHEWLRNSGVARMGVLAFITIGSAFVTDSPGSYYLFGLYLFAFATNHLYLYGLYIQRAVSVSQTWAHMFVDFAVVALTIAFTDGPASFFSFLFVIVVLEVGVLLGLRQGFVFATLASIFMFEQTMTHPVTDEVDIDSFGLWYNYGVQVMLMYLTAFISGFWNTRIHRLREFQREILDNMNAGFVITDARGIVRAHNQSATNILGFHEQLALGRPITEVMQAASGSECPVLTALRSGQDYTSYEFQLQHPSGKSLLLGLTTNHVYSANDTTTGIIVSFTDLTEMDVMRNELRKQDRLAVIGELAAGLAHEIRNPVAVIRGAIDELSTSADVPELRERLQDMALRESDHLNEIVQGFLNYSLDPSPALQRIELIPVVEDVLQLIRREYDNDSNLTINFHPDLNAGWVLGDASQLKQVFVNIAHNAVEAMKHKGDLQIHVYQFGDGPVEVRFEDTGPGIDPERIDKVFEPFFTMKDSGTGMGLAVCMRIVTAHNGTLRAMNRAGGGCTMIVQLPLARIAPKEIADGL